MARNIYDDWGKGDDFSSSDEEEYWTHDHDDEKSDVLQEEVPSSYNVDQFFLDLLKGRLGQVIVESIFRKFNYEVYPYGYESYFTNIIKSMGKSNSNSLVNKIRCTRI